MDKLEGDEFTTNDWVRAHTQELGETTPDELPKELFEAMSAFSTLALKLGIPAFASVCLKDEIITISELGNKPQNVPMPFMLARAGVSGNEDYNQHFAMNALSKLGDVLLRK